MVIFTVGIFHRPILIPTIHTVISFILRFQFVVFNSFELRIKPNYASDLIFHELYIFVNICNLFVDFFLEPGVLARYLDGHSDAIWCLTLHKQKSQMLSCSADGSVKLWSPAEPSPVLSTYVTDSGEFLKIR